MAGSAVIGALRVILGADTAAFETGLKNAKGKAGSFADSVAKIFSGVALERGLEKSIEAVVHAFKQAVTHADDMGKAAAKVGIPVEELTKLKFAADLSDVSMESLSIGLGKLSKSMLEVARGGGDQAKLAFDQLGISVTKTDGSLKSAGDVLAEVAGKFGGLNDGAAKSATAMVLFGKSGKDLIPLLNEGKGGIEEMMKAAEKMGLVISTKTAAQSQVFNDNVKLLQLASQGLANMVVAQLLPAMVRLSDQWVQTAKDGDTMRVAASKIVEWIKEIVIVGAQAVALNDLLGQSFIHLQEAVTSFPNFDKSQDAVVKLREVWASIGPRLEGLRITVNKLFDDVESKAKAAGDLEFDAAVSKAIDDLSFKTRILKGDFDKLAQGFPEAAKGLGIFGQTANDNRTSLELLTPAQLKLNEALNAFKAAQITQDSLLPWQAYEQTLMRINTAFENGTKNPEAYAQAMQKAAEQAGATWDLAGASIAGSFAKITGAFGKENSAMAKAAKIFGAIQATISMFTGAAKALELPFPANIAAMAAVLAQGAALVANIRGTDVPGAAKGGSFMVPGGKSMTDNMMVPLNLASGERVDITPANDVGRAPGNISVTLVGEKFSRDQVRELFETLNSGLRDGHKINVAA